MLNKKQLEEKLNGKTIWKILPKSMTSHKHKYIPGVNIVDTFDNSERGNGFFFATEEKVISYLTSLYKDPFYIFEIELLDDANYYMFECGKIKTNKLKIPEKLIELSDFVFANIEKFYENYNSFRHIIAYTYYFFPNKTFIIHDYKISRDIKEQVLRSLILLNNKDPFDKFVEDYSMTKNEIINSKCGYTNENVIFHMINKYGFTNKDLKLKISSFTNNDRIDTLLNLLKIKMFTVDNIKDDTIFRGDIIKCSRLYEILFILKEVYNINIYEYVNGHYNSMNILCDKKDFVSLSLIKMLTKNKWKSNNIDIEVIEYMLSQDINLEDYILELLNISKCDKTITYLLDSNHFTINNIIKHLDYYFSHENINVDFFLELFDKYSLSKYELLNNHILKKCIWIDNIKILCKKYNLTISDLKDTIDLIYDKIYCQHYNIPLIINFLNVTYNTNFSSEYTTFYSKDIEKYASCYERYNNKSCRNFIVMSKSDAELIDGCKLNKFHCILYKYQLLKEIGISDDDDDMINTDDKVIIIGNRIKDSLILDPKEYGLVNDYYHKVCVDKFDIHHKLTCEDFIDNHIHQVFSDDNSLKILFYIRNNEYIYTNLLVNLFVNGKKSKINKLIKHTILYTNIDTIDILVNMLPYLDCQNMTINNKQIINDITKSDCWLSCHCNMFLKLVSSGILNEENIELIMNRVNSCNKYIANIN